MNEQENDSVFWGFFIDVAIVIAAFVMFAKTQEVMTYLAPKTLFGQQGLALIYGFAVAALIEGVMLALHFLKRYIGNNRAEGYKWFLFSVSVFCQFLDGSLFKTEKTQTEAFFAFIAIGIVPAIMFGLLWVKGGKKTVTARGPRKGIIPSLKETLYGSENTAVSPKEVAHTSNMDVEKVKTRTNGKKEETESNPK